MKKGRLEQLKDEEIPFDKRVDIEGIETDLTMSDGLSAEEYLTKIKNPYAFRCGNIAVNIRFSQNGRKLADILAACFYSEKNRN